ncbi:MAG: response regulator transcription factor [Acetobacteraceae bacterium]|jgi:two-component system phosphate regulon response regulator OmpR|nr:response regulator transcription factor [Acetobacteraceae bacterium]
MTQLPRLLIVEDEADIAEAVAEYMAANGLSVRTAGDVPAARVLVGEAMPDVVMLDIALPGEDGLSLARALRAAHGQSVGIIMVTAASDVVDRVVGLEVGADDYVAKPFDLRELLARVRAVLRRVEAARAAVALPAKPAERLPFGPLTVDLAARRLLDPGGDEITLTAMEFDLVLAFAERPGRVLSRAQLLDIAHPGGSDPFDRSIDVRITRLRRKIETNPDAPALIRTVRGVGYVFEG